jgi:hypothetical protein
MIRFPRSLRAGDSIAVTAPSSEKAEKKRSKKV